MVLHRIPGRAVHLPEAPIGQKGAFYAAKVIAATAYDLYTRPELRKEIQDEFDAQDREPYAPMYEGE